MAVDITGLAVSTQGYGTAGRNIIRLSTGQLWMLVVASSNSQLQFWYSNDDGATWAEDTLARKNCSNPWHASICTDIDDNIWLAYVISTGTFDLKVLAGTVSGNVITWASGAGIWSVGGWVTTPMYATVIAFREGVSDIRVFLAFKRNDVGGAYYYYNKWDGSAWSGAAGTGIPFSPSGNISLDFHHTGDGLTVQGGTPHVYMCVVQDGGGSGSDDFYFYKLSYAAGPTWTLGTQRVLDTGSGGRSNAITDLYFDGTRVVMTCDDGAGPPLIYERDAADTITTQRVISTTGLLSSAGCLLTWDKVTKDIYINGWNSSSHPVYVRYDRAGNSWDASPTVLEAVAATTGQKYLATLRGDKGIYPAWFHVTGSRYYIEPAATLFNSPPNAPTWVSPADNIAHDVTASLFLDWAFSDPNPGDTQGAYTLRRTIGATVTYWNGTGWQASEDGTTKISSATTSQTLAASWGSDGDVTHKYAVKTWDALDLAGPFGSDLLVIPSAKDEPSISSPTLDQVVATSSHLVTWTVATQTKKRIKLYANSGGSPGAELFDSGIVTDGTKSYTINDLANATTYHVGVQTWNDEGLIGTETTRRFSVAYTPPTTPTVVATAGTGYIDVVITNPAGGATFDYNEVYRRIGTGAYIRRATGIAEDATFRDYAVASGQLYEYKVRTWATNGAYAEGT